MGVLFRLYVNALLKGNPFVVGITVLGAVALAAGPFSEQLSKRDPYAIGMVVFAGLLVSIVLAVAIIDRRNNPEFQRRKKKKKKAPAARR